MGAACTTMEQGTVYNDAGKGVDSMTPERQNAGLRSMARDQSAKRKWSRQPPHTTMMSARVPTWLADKVRRFVDKTGGSVSDVIVIALDEWIKRNSPYEDEWVYPCSPLETGRKEDEGED